MIISNKITLEKALRKFGLTEKEGEIYIFLTKRGAQKTGKIAEQLKKNKGLVYRILKSLQKKGLVEATLEHPTRFTAVSFEKIIDSFIKSKREEVKKIEESKRDLISDWNKISHSELDSALEKFAVIEGNKKIFDKISQMVKVTHSQFSMASTVSDLLRAEQLGVFDTIYAHSLKSEVQFRFLTQLTKENLKAFKWLRTKLKPELDLKGRNPDLGFPTFSRMAIRDKEEILLFISDQIDRSPNKLREVCLCTNCKSIIQAFSGVFEESWQNSADIKHLLDEIETGKSLPKTQLIKDPSFAKKSYYGILNSANEEILIVTSSEGLNRLSKNKSQLEKWFKRGVSIRIMAPIVNTNLEATQRLLQWAEIKHIPMGYFETTIVDGNHLFQFKHPSPQQAISPEILNFENTFYTNDTQYIQKTRSLLSNIWRKTRTPTSENAELVSRSGITSAKQSIDRHSIVKRQSFLRNMKFKQIEKISEDDVLDKIKKEKKLSKKNPDWSDTVRYFSSRASAIIQPPKSFALPKMFISVFHHDEDSSFGAENYIMIDLWKKTKEGFYYVPTAVVQDTSESLALRRAVMVGFPAEKNIMVFEKDEMQVRVKGNTLFAGWTKSIPLIPYKYVLPPSCILFEGYGDVRSGAFTNVTASGRRQEVWYNSFDAFISFFHPQSKYVGSGTEGFIEREGMLISRPPKSANKV